MTLASTATTNNQYINNNPLPWKQQNNLEFPKQDKGASSLFERGLLLGSIHEDDSDEVVEIIHDSNFLDTDLYQLSNWLFAGISWEAWKELLPFRETEVSPTTDVVEKIYKNIILGEMFARLEVIAQREDDWDGLGSMKPNKISLDRAEHIMMKLLDSIISDEDEWIEPYICSDENGYITIEWYGNERELHLRIEEREVEYIEIESIDTEMRAHVDTISGDDCSVLWKWLINEQ